MTTFNPQRTIAELKERRALTGDADDEHRIALTLLIRTKPAGW